MLQVSYQELFDALLRVSLKVGFEPPRARLCGQLFADTTRDGVYSHGLNRFPRFVAMIRNGSIDIHAKPELRDWSPGRWSAGTEKSGRAI